MWVNRFPFRAAWLPGLVFSAIGIRAVPGVLQHRQGLIRRFNQRPTSVDESRKHSGNKQLFPREGFYHFAACRGQLRLDASQGMTPP